IEESITNRKLNISEIIKDNGKYFHDYYWDDTYPPGTRYTYSGFNFLIIATILEKITKQRFNQLAHTILINKLQLQNTHLATSLPLAETKYAIGYNFINDVPEITLDDNKFQLRIVNKKYVVGRNPTTHSPQSSFRSNITDLSKVMKMLLNNGVYENTQILNKDSVKLFENPIFKTTTIHRGLGTEINYQLIPGLKMIGHSGNAYGILTHFFYNREENFGIIFIINGLKMLVYEEGGDHLQIEREIPKKIYDRLIKKKESIPTSSTKNLKVLFN
ncbi:MAG: serine hydrolase domain-containing protein, partial [Candidatus Riflemargulisbacteria bacterium]